MRIILMLMIAGLAGCVTVDDAPASTTEEQPEPEPIRLPAAGIDWDLLSTDEFGILPLTRHYVSSHDGILLHVVVHLPDGTGPWPTIFQNSPYYSHPVDGATTIGLVNTYVPKGYAVVSADVRGTGNSEGCMNMMGPDERRDTYELVEWIAAQDWSDGHVGMQGVSYVGTTPHEALIEAPPHLDTVVTIAGVTNQWRNVYQGGVPYNARFYPITYEATEGAPPPTDVSRGPLWAFNAAAGACEQEEALIAMSPGTYEKGVYSSYWDDRNFTKHVANAKASILYSQGFVDRAVNPIEAVHWFNELPVPKKAFLHQAGHQYPPRADYFPTELAWFDYWLKGIENGVMTTPTVEVQLNDGRIRVDDVWPPKTTATKQFTLGMGELFEPGSGQTSQGPIIYSGGPVAAARAQIPGSSATSATFTSPPLAEEFLLTGSAVLDLHGAVTANHPVDNGFWLFDLYDEGANGARTWIAEGWFNAHLKGGFDHSEPLTPGTNYDFQVTFEPRDYVFAQDHRIVLVASGYDSGVSPWDEPDVLMVIETGISQLTLPTVAEPAIYEAPKEVTDGIDA